MEKLSFSFGITVTGPCKNPETSWYVSSRIKRNYSSEQWTVGTQVFGQKHKNLVFALLVVKTPKGRRSQCVLLYFHTLKLRNENLSIGHNLNKISLPFKIKILTGSNTLKKYITGK